MVQRIQLKNTWVYRCFLVGQILRKPGSVLADHLSSRGVATAIKRITPMDYGGKPPKKGLIHHLAASRVYLFTTSPL